MLPVKDVRPIDYLRDVIRYNLNLQEDRVNIYNQKFSIPNDQYLFIGIEYKMSKVYASKSEFEDTTDGFIEKQGLNTQEHYAILIFSRNTDALLRKEEVVQALGSIYAQQQGSAYGFSIARIAPIQDLSNIEGAAILYRFEISVVMLCRYEKIIPISWYGTFPFQVTEANGITTTTPVITEP